MSYLSFVQTEIANKPTFTPLTAQDIPSILRTIYGITNGTPENALTKLNRNWQDQNPNLDWADISNCFQNETPTFINRLTDHNRLFVNMMAQKHIYNYHDRDKMYRLFRHNIAKTETLYAQIDNLEYIETLCSSQKYALKGILAKLVWDRFESCNPNCSEIVDEAVKMYLENQQNSLFSTCITIAQNFSAVEFIEVPETKPILWRQGFLPRCKSGVHFALQIKLNNKIIK